eukprot:5877839-Prymnesium_polylepis.5
MHELQRGPAAALEQMSLQHFEGRAESGRQRRDRRSGQGHLQVVDGRQSDADRSAHQAHGATAAWHGAIRGELKCADERRDEQLADLVRADAVQAEGDVRHSIVQRPHGSAGRHAPAVGARRRARLEGCLLYTSPSPRDAHES